MGLRISHGIWDGAYSAFSRYRNKLASVVGIPLNLMDGHYKFEQNDQLPISWDILKPDVLHVLLHHSDCEGIIKVRYLALLADRLEGLLPLLDNDENSGGHIGDYRIATMKFIKGLRLAHSLNEDIEFC